MEMMKQKNIDIDKRFVQRVRIVMAGRDFFVLPVLMEIRQVCLKVFALVFAQLDTIVKRKWSYQRNAVGIRILHPVIRCATLVTIH